MTDRGRVYNEYRSFRNSYDVDAQTERHIAKSLFWCGVLMGGSLLIGGLLVPMQALVLLTIPLGFTIMGPIIFYYMGRMQTKMNKAHQGYDVDWRPDRERWFGTDTYYVLRADPGIMQGMSMSLGGNLIGTSKHTLKDLESEQRNGATCDVCGRDDMFDGLSISNDGAYFVEERERTWLFGVPVSESVVGWDTYCPEHRPDV